MEDAGRNLGCEPFYQGINLTHERQRMLEDGIISLDPLASQTQLFIGLITKDTAHYLMLGILPQLDCTLHIDPVARLESFRALKLSRLESFRVLKS